MSIFYVLMLLFWNGFYLLSASTVSSVLADDHSQVPIPVYTVNGTTESGLQVNGVIVFSCHTTPKDCYLPLIREFAQETKHFIVESDPFNYRTNPSYHEDGDFLSNKIICECENIGKLSEQVGVPNNELLKGYPIQSTPLQTLNWLWLSIMTGFSDENGIDMWVCKQAKTNNFYCFLFSLEDACDRVNSNEETMFLPEETKNWEFEKCKNLLQQFHGFIKTDKYMAYKEYITKIVEGGEIHPTKLPELVIKEGYAVCEWTTTEESIFAEEGGINCYGRWPLETCSDSPMVCRNRLWLERLRARILPAINGEPFILVVGADHALVRAESGESLGVLTFFENLVGQKNVQLLNSHA